MVDETLILHLPKEICLEMIKIGRVWSEANITLMIIEFDFSGIGVCELDIINSQELVQCYSDSTPFSVCQDVLILINCTGDGCFLIDFQVLDDFL